MSSIVPNISKLHRTSAYRAIVDAWRVPVALACSAGVDSTALLLVAARALKKGRVAPFVVVHVDHRTRPQILEEIQFLSAISYALELPFCSVRVDPHRGPEAGASPEAYLRASRYDALRLIVGRLRLHGVVTAHTLDDQVETIIMRLVSGSGALGSSGMDFETVLPTRVGKLRILRPLLSVRRSKLDELLEMTGIEPFLDASNIDRSYRRNAIRHDVIPVLRAIDPGFDKALSRSVMLSARDAHYIDRVADDIYHQVVLQADDGVRICRRWIREADPALATRVIRRAIFDYANSDPREITFERIESVRLAAFGRTGAVVQVPGNLDALVKRDQILLRVGGSRLQ